MKAVKWIWDEVQPKTDKTGRPVPYKIEENGQIKWKCKNCKGIYFKILDDSTLICFACNKPLYTGR